MDDEIIRNIENAHYQLQNNIYFSEMKKIDGALLLLSDKIEDFFWNYAAEINIKEENVNELIKMIIDFYSSNNRDPAIYITPSTRPLNLQEYLKELGFELQFSDAWMFYNNNQKKKNQKSSIFNIKEVKNKDEIELFVKIFNEVYGGTPTDDEPYGGLPSYYGEALQESFLKSHQNKIVNNYIAYLDNKVVGIGSLISTKKYAGIYNVGTIPEFRKKGVGTAISMKAIDDSIKQNIEILFLQTEKGSYVEQFYTNLGFSTRFYGEGYVLSE